MSSEELISAGDFCTFYQVELSFIQNLHESGLIDMTVMDGSAYLPAGELPALEKFVRWHYELSINPEGIEALSHVLQQMHQLMGENRALRSRLRRFEILGSSGPAEE